MKSKKLFMMLLAVCGMVFASESNFVQFTRDAFNTYDIYQDWNDATGQQIGWRDSHMITLSVSGGSTVYITNYISNWYGTVEDLGSETYADGYNMSTGAYGYMVAEKTADGKITTKGDIHLGTGKTKDITYYNADGTISKTTKGYELGYFENDTEIFFVMTPHGYDTKVDSYYPVHDPDNEPAYQSILKSRQIDGFQDRAGNWTVNFGVGPIDAPEDQSSGYQFVLGYEASNTPPPPSGQPLPGVLSTIIVACCSIACAKKMKKNK